MTPSSQPPSSTAAVPARAAALIVDAFLDYNARFADITRRAKRHFEQRDWSHAHDDALARIDLYDLCINETFERLDRLLDERLRSKSLWAAIRDDYARLIEPQSDKEFFKTFFNTLSRRFFRTLGVDGNVEFIALDIEPTAGIAEPVAATRYAIAGDGSAAFMRVLDACAFANGYADRARCARAIAREVAERSVEDGRALREVEFLDTVFYRERRAYLVGRIVEDGEPEDGSLRDGGTPIAIALVSETNGVRADAVLTNLNHFSLLFSYARSYFHADLPAVGNTVAFLEALLPHKPVGEIFTVLGRAKQGKTERYRHLFRHLSTHPHERLIRAAGERGMVMAVFTPRDYPVVFKVIRDRFAYPKDIGRRQVEEKYRLVFRYDRIGRLVDAQEFRYLRFPLAQFAADMLEELMGECAETVEVDGDDLLVKHCYVERRLYPLNLYAREAEPDAALRAVLDYGQAIKDLACSNIFPGDLLLKNFGVSRIGRAIFYDYDELCLVEHCRFRQLPEASIDDETRPLEDWLSVRADDVFPEQFPRFLGLPAKLRDALIATHPEIFDALWWQALRARLAAGDYGDVPPYPASARLPMH